MNKEQQRALLKVVMWIARMIVYQGNIFGTEDTRILGKYMEDLLETLPKE